MKTKKPDRGVAQMTVLKDIRGLLSITLEQSPTVEVNQATAPDLQAEKLCFEEQLRQYKELVQKQQTALDRLEVEKNELDEKLRFVQSAASKRASQQTVGDSSGREISDLEARKAELSAALAQVEQLLQFKIRELTRRIARVYQEAGDIEAGRDFRRITDQIEAAENFGEFLRALLSG
jgi:hypothetical protein